jgi:chemotaxis protein MotB
MARKKKHEEHENLERWLVSYADFITLLFAFFVVMYSISAINEGKFRVLSEALVAAFRSQPKSLDPIQFGDPLRARRTTPDARNPTRPLDNPPVAIPPPPIASPIKTDHPPASDGPQRQAAIAARQAVQQIADELEQALGDLIRKDLVTVRRSSLWMEVEIKTSILFPSGSARLEPEAVPTLEKIAGVLRRFSNPVHVEGFTDDRPINTEAFPSNWELSAARAASVVHLFARAGVSPQRMAAVGFGEYHPRADNSTPEGRQANRRVLLVVLADPGARHLLDFTAEPRPASEAAEEAVSAAVATGGERNGRP